jgi:zinc/manganese transport system permease protein
MSVHGLPFAACLVMLGLLSYIGIHVLKREVIFIDIALAQIAAVGTISAHVVFHLHGNSFAANGLAFGSTLIAAAFFAVVRLRIKQIPLEAVIGVSYAVSAAAALFIVGVSPGGHVHIHEMLAGSILWATWGGVLWSAGIFAVVGLCFYLFRRPFSTISESYEDALAKGYGTLGWDFLFYALIGIVITTAVRTAGVVVVFTFLIIPATLSAMFATGWGARLAIGWVAGAASAALGLLFANRFDFSVGPAIALFLGGGLIAAGILRAVKLSRTVTASLALLAALAMGWWFASGGSASADIRGGMASSGGFGGAPSAGTITHSHNRNDHAAALEHEEETVLPVDELIDIGEIEARYREATDSDERSAAASRALALDPRAGARLALEFLRDDPPLLFRQAIVEELERASGVELGYDIDLPFDSEVNRESVSRLKAAIGMD